jgi:hypothetical protein
MESGFAAERQCSADSQDINVTTALWRPILLLALIAAAPLTSSAQDAPAREDWYPRRGTSPVFGVGYQSPDGPALSAGLIIGTVPGKANKCIFGATSSGLLVQGHVGLNGPKLSVGIAQYNPGFGIGGKVSGLHLWRSSGQSRAGTTFLGPEVEMSVFLVRLSAGLLWRVAGPGGDPRRFTWGAGLGF